MEFTDIKLKYIDLKSRSVWLGLAAILLGFLQLFGVGGPDLQGSLAPLGKLVGTLMGTGADPVLLIITGGGLITLRKGIKSEATLVNSNAIIRAKIDRGFDPDLESK